MTGRSMWRRGVGAVLGAAAVWAMVLAPQAALAAMEPGAHSSAAVVSVDATTMMTTADAKDADDDTIPDVVEREVCGTATCAVGTEDEDADGIPDWTEVLSCDSPRPSSVLQPEQEPRLASPHETPKRRPSTSVRRPA
ncbi:hypothetical protein [Microbacterium hydrocarbonoxydans]|nr:hypothetical protein [Microbacterium hydrocarbonoxydans]